MKNIVLLLLVVGFVFACTSNDFESSSSDSPAINGSYASMLVVSDFLYAINRTEITTFDIKDTQNPIEIDKQEVGFNVENIYHHVGVLFIGSQSGMHIFEIGQDGVPERKSQTEYVFDEIVTPCDPVIADDQYAYVTLKTSFESSGPCPRWIDINELRIYDVSDISNPKLLNTVQMNFPSGLAIDGKHLFVCEANNGFKVLDVSNPTNLDIVSQFDGFESFDVIARDGLLMVVGPKEIRQYDYSDIDNIVYLSTIEL